MENPESPSVHSTWEGPRPFVGRTKVFDQLEREMSAALEEGGRAAFLLGAEGSGKTASLAVFQELAFRAHRGLTAEYVDCAHSGTKTWFELAEIFTRGHRLRRSAGLVAIDWLESIPIVGKIAQAVVRTIVAVRTGHVDPGKLRRGRALSMQETALSAVRALLEIQPMEPRLIIMDSFDRGDSEDLAGASALLRRLPDTRTLFLAAVRTQDGRPPPRVEDLILEAERLGRGCRIELPPLAAGEVREAVETATHSSLDETWTEWLAARSRGVPSDLWSLLGALQEGGALTKSGRKWKWDEVPPTDLPADGSGGPTRDWGLSEEDGRLVAMAACEGPVFDSAVVAELAGMSELAAEDRFARLCRIGLIEFRDASETGADLTSLYAFRHERDARHFAGVLADEERRRLRERLSQIRARKL